MEDREYSVSEAVRLTGVPSHVLRYWEEELQIAIKRTSQGHRIYSEKDLELFRRVKEWKDKGIQLKAIRVLIDGREQDARLAEDIREIDQAGEQSRKEDSEPEEELSYEVIPVSEKVDNLKQFEQILKRMIEDVMTEQNEKMEQVLVAAIREEIEELYMQIALQEAAATRKEQEKQESALKRLWKILTKKA